MEPGSLPEGIIGEAEARVAITNRDTVLAKIADRALVPRGDKRGDHQSSRRVVAAPGGSKRQVLNVSPRSSGAPVLSL